MALLSTAAMLTACQNNSAKVDEKQITLNTYPFSDANPVADPYSPFYPYFTFDGYSHEGSEKEWDAVVLENDLIKVTVVPSIGGKIWGAVEKSTGEEFIYYNNSAKFRNIAMRGPWTSGGIEPNFGIIGHAPTCSTPVDYTTRKNDDGSVSCFVGSLDMLTSTWWSVEVRLEKDKSYFTTSTSWNNASPLEQPLYHWMNAGFKASDDMQFYFPGDTYIGHGGEVSPWSIDEQGRDLSHYANNNFGSSKSMHVTGGLGEYFGAYWNNTEFGTVHHSDYDEKLGMKIFIWGLARDGMIWEDLLTDTDGQYLEMQSGRMFNQASPNSNLSPYKHMGLESYTTDNWREYWYPVKNTKGIATANALGVLNLVKDDGKVEIRFCPTGKINKAIKVYHNDQIVFEDQIKSKAMQTWIKQINVDPKESLRIVIGDSEMEYSEDPTTLLTNRPKYAPEDFDWQSVYGLYLNGKLLMNEKKYVEAKSYIEQSLAKDHNFAPALNLAATLNFRMGRYEESLSYSTRSLSINAYDADANYIYALACSRLGKTNDAIDGFSVAAQTPSHRTAAYIELTRQFISKNNFARAEIYARKALKQNPYNQTAMVLNAVVDRKLGEESDADDILEKYPLNHFALYEIYAEEESKAAANNIKNNIRNEMPYQTYLEMAGWYETMGCIEDAINILKLSEKNTLIEYRLAYLLNKQGKKDDAEKMLETANNSSLELVFPYRRETLEALKWAYSKTNNWHVRYLLALNYSALGNIDQGKTLLAECADQPTYAPLYMTRALTESGESKLADLRASEKLDKSWRVGLELIKYYNSQKLYAKALEVGSEYTKLYPANYILALKYAYSMVKTGNYDKCIDYIKTIKVLPNEGATEGRITYRDANLLSAIENIKAKNFDKALAMVEQSKIYLENLGVGKPYDNMIDMRSTDFITAECYAAMGNKAKSDEYYKKVADGNKSMNSNMLLTALAQAKCGDTAKAKQTITTFESKAANSQIAAYCKHRFAGNRSAAEAALATVVVAKEASPWEANYSDNDIDLVRAIVDNI
ncbi:MAG: DUF5107 domain-containing protein [Rikenellaceae bacterium]